MSRQFCPNRTAFAIHHGSGWEMVLDTNFTAFVFSMFCRLILRYPGLRNGNGFCGGVPYHTSYGDLNVGFAIAAVQFNALHA